VTDSKSYGLPYIEASMRAVNLEMRRRRYLAELAVNSGMWSKEVAEAVYSIKFDTNDKGNSK
jgi:hypothetical protein